MKKSNEVGGVGAATPYLKEIAIDSIMASATNPRKSFPSGPLAELAESIKAHGIKQPILVRPLTRYELAEPDLAEKRWHLIAHEPDGLRNNNYFESEKLARSAFAEATAGRASREWEIVCGERRFRAAILAKLKSMPCMVEALGNQAAKEIQLVENGQREGITPIEEAAGFKALIDEHGYTVAKLCERTGKSRSHIFARLALLKLDPAVRKAVEAGDVDASVAELIGRYEPKQQEKALKLVLENRRHCHNGETNRIERENVSFRRAKELLARGFTVELKQAKGKFDLEAAYAPAFKNGKAGECLPKCGACPHRSGNCMEEWPELASPDVCTRPSCFHQKESLAAELKLQPFAKKGMKVLGLKESQGLFTAWGDFSSSKYAQADQVVNQDKKRRTVQQILRGRVAGGGGGIGEGWETDENLSFARGDGVAGGARGQEGIPRKPAAELEGGTGGEGSAGEGACAQVAGGGAGGHRDSRCGDAAGGDGEGN